MEKKEKTLDPAAFLGAQVLTPLEQSKLKGGYGRDTVTVTVTVKVIDDLVDGGVVA